MNNLESQGLEEQGFEVWVRVNEKNEIIMLWEIKAHTLNHSTLTNL